MTMTDVERDWVLRHLYERGVDVAVAESVEAAFAVADLVRRELDAPADRDALWRDYEEARDKVIDHASLWGAGAAEKAPLLLDALDAAVRALAAGDGQDSRAWLVAIAERLDALNRTIAAAHGLCIQCMERPRLEALRICGTCYRIGVPHGQDAA